MFKIEKDNQKTGKYLKSLILSQFRSVREFCKAYITETGSIPNEDNLRSLSNRMSQIIHGNKAIQTYDLPYFTSILGVTCEQILSAGTCIIPSSTRITNYSIASSKDQSEWDKYINRDDKLILNCDEYNKTILDYALEFGNYELLKYLLDKGYIWFDSGDQMHYAWNFGAGTSIKRRNFASFDNGLSEELTYKDELRVKLISLATENEDLKMLNELRARETPQLYSHANYLNYNYPKEQTFYDKNVLSIIASSGNKVLDYFTDEFCVKTSFKDSAEKELVNTFIFPYISELLNKLIQMNSPFTETAIKKALRHNKNTYKKLCTLFSKVKNSDHFQNELFKGLWADLCAKDFEFHEDGNFVIFRYLYSYVDSLDSLDGIITNIAHITKKTNDPVLNELIIELNESYDDIRYINDHLEEVIK